MGRTYVALDLETTGLDPDRDEIIEVGAYRFDLKGRCESFGTFVDPKRSIPYRIQRLTGIAERDVTGAPLMAEVAGRLEEFIGDSVIIGQNIAFDLNFLRRARIRAAGPAYDTQELASLLLPGLVEHSLRGIARHLQIEFPVQHRALADADAARLVFLALRERMRALPPSLLAEASRLASQTDWPLRHLLQEVLDELPALIAPDADAGLMHGAVRPPEKYGPPLRGPGDSETLDAQEVAHLLTAGARNVVEGFEERPEQLEMARAVTATLNGGGQLLVEAGTGVGKSLAYLLPSALYAQRNNTRVVVSTNTINLQEQLIGQDIPIVRRLLGEQGDELRTAQLKGRRNYLCLLRWSNMRRSPTPTADETKLLVRLLLWLPHTDTGDRAELRLPPGEDAVWNKLNAQDGACMTSVCPFVRDGSCFLLRARRRAEAAHLLVVNHALMLSDVAVGGGVIPEYDHLVVDEAHHLEDEATDQFGFEATEQGVADLLDRIGGRRGGLTGSARNALRGPVAGRPGAEDARKLATRVDEAADRAREHLPEFFLRLVGFVRQQSNSMSDYEERLRLTRAMRVQPDWADVELAWENMSAAMGQLGLALQALHTALQAPDLEGALDREALLAESWDLLQTAAGVRQGISEIVLHDDSNRICWLSSGRGGNGVSLSSAPLRVAELLEERLYSRKEATVLTSATLSVEGRFDYVRGALGLQDASELALGSPFDYASSTIVLAPSDMPEPNQPNYMASLQQALIDLVRASGGRALALFTSHSSLRAAYHGIKPALEQEDILVLGHNLDGSPRQLIHALREHPHTVVLGAASFWEGIDIVGDALSLLVIARLPFSVPDDPIFQARSELYDDSFNDFALPQAVLRFKQGFGRLIRRKTDRGVMAVLDSRVVSKSYGLSFLHSLPSCALHRVPLHRMPPLVSQWLDDPA